MSSIRRRARGPVSTASALLILSGCAREEPIPAATAVTTQAPAEAPPVVYAAAPVATVPPTAYVTAGGTMAAFASPPAVAVNVDPRWAGVPSVQYQDFLEDSPDEAKRQVMWTLFQRAEAEARKFPTSPSRWVPLIRIELVPQNAVAGDWNSSGVIQMKPDQDPGVMFHEIFHTVFDRAELHTREDGVWTEAFCDAFRYYAERELLPASEQPTKWGARITRYMGMTEDEVMAGGGTFWKQKYVYPASIIVKRAGGTAGSLATLRSLWFSLIALKQQRGGDVLSEYFGFTPPHIKKKS